MGERKMNLENGHSVQIILSRCERIARGLRQWAPGEGGVHAREFNWNEIANNLGECERVARQLAEFYALGDETNTKDKKMSSITFPFDEPISCDTLKLSLGLRIARDDGSEHDALLTFDLVAIAEKLDQDRRRLKTDAVSGLGGTVILGAATSKEFA